MQQCAFGNQVQKVEVRCASLHSIRIPLRFLLFLSPFFPLSLLALDILSAACVGSRLSHSPRHITYTRARKKERESEKGMRVHWSSLLPPRSRFLTHEPCPCTSANGGRMVFARITSFVQLCYSRDVHLRVYMYRESKELVIASKAIGMAELSLPLSLCSSVSVSEFAKSPRPY